MARICEVEGHDTGSARWLDVGCATGDFVEAAVAAGASAEGIDAARGAVDAARARGLVVHQARVEDFHPELPYTVITAFDLIEYLLDPRAFVRRLFGWLAPGSRPT